MRLQHSFTVMHGGGSVMVFYIRDPDSVLFWTQVLLMTHSGVCLQVCDSEEPLLHFLLSMCSSEAVRRPVCLTCRRHAPSRAPGNTNNDLQQIQYQDHLDSLSSDLRRFSRADRDFITRMTPPLQLTCVHLHS